MRVPCAVLIALGLIAGCAAAPLRPSPVAPAAAGAGLGARAATLASGLIGTPYRYGGRSRAGLDCSGLVFYVYRELGLAVPRTAAEQRAAAVPVAAEALRPGDLVFFYTPEDHVGVYLGNSEFVHAPASGRPVERARLDSPFFILGFAGGGRLAGP
ncbi:MAG TPA: C40 family peptidase [Steroidobacteraceae bacterium]|nr:C40 family peptidase [Steroidobacteraceae bacterium]